MKNNSTNSIALLLLSVGLFYTFTNVEYQKVKELNVVAEKYHDVLQDVSRIIELRDNLLITYESIPEAEIERINKALPDNIDTVHLAFDLDDMAARYGIAVKDIQAVVGSSGSSNVVVLPEFEGVYEKSTVSFTFVSTYANFMRLLADLETNLRIMDVTSISFQANDTGLYEYQVSVETYWLK